MAAAYAKAILCEIFPKDTAPDAKVGTLCINAYLQGLVADRSFLWKKSRNASQAPVISSSQT
jgi:hypothetical protein